MRDRLGRLRAPLRTWLLCSVFSVPFYCPTLSAAAALIGEPISPLPTVESLNLNPDKVKLGEQLFNEKRFSRDNSTACASCHDLKKGGVDGMSKSIGVRQQMGGINAPTVYNSGLNFQQFWNGRAPNLEDQINQVIHNPKEMDMTWPEIIAILSKDEALNQQFKSLYSDGMQEKNIEDAIATFERSLLTPSRFDRYLQGDNKAINDNERHGYQLFKEYGCIACHQGVNVGGNMFQKFGAMDDYFAKRGNPTDADLGRFAVTKQEEDKHVFKVPSLRNVALTAPYFHDASAQTLEQAVDVMFQYQLGRTGSAADKQAIIAFLKALTGEQLEAKP